jgi:hypothetical protein
VPSASGSERPRARAAQSGTKGPKRTPRPERSARSGPGSNGDGHAPLDLDDESSAADDLVLGVAAAGSVSSGDATVVEPLRPPEGPPVADADTTAVPAVAPVAPVAAPPEGRRRRREDADPDLVKVGRRQGRRVRRIVRRVDLWSVLKLAVVLYTCLYAAVMATLALLWGLAYSSGQIEKVQSFMSDVGLDNYRFYGDQMWRACAMIGAIGVLAATVVTVLTAALVNVISETTGGIRFVVIEEDPRPRRRPPTR